MDNLVKIWYHCAEIMDNLVHRFTDPRNVANQILKNLKSQIKSLEDSYYEIQVKFDLLVAKVDEAIKEQNIWKDRIPAALRVGNELLAKQAAAQVVKQQQLIDRYAVQLATIEPLKATLLDEIYKYSNQKESIETEVEILCTEYSIEKSRNNISKLLHGVGHNSNVTERLREFKDQVRELRAQSSARLTTSAALSPKQNLEEQFIQLDAQVYDGKAEKLIEEAREQLKLIAE